MLQEDESWATLSVLLELPLGMNTELNKKHIYLFIYSLTNIILGNTIDSLIIGTLDPRCFLPEHFNRTIAH